MITTDFLSLNRENPITAAATDRMKKSLYSALEKVGLQPSSVRIEVEMDSVKVFINFKIQNFEKLIVLCS